MATGLMRQYMIRVDPEKADAIEDEARREGLTLNKTLVALIDEALTRRVAQRGHLAARQNDGREE